MEIPVIRLQVVSLLYQELGIEKVSSCRLPNPFPYMTEKEKLSYLRNVFHSVQGYLSDSSRSRVENLLAEREEREGKKVVQRLLDSRDSDLYHLRILLEISTHHPHPGTEVEDIIETYVLSFQRKGMELQDRSDHSDHSLTEEEQTRLQEQEDRYRELTK